MKTKLIMKWAAAATLACITLNISASADTLVTYNLGVNPTGTNAIVSGSFTGQLTASAADFSKFGAQAGFSTQSPKNNIYIRYNGMTQNLVKESSYMDFTISPQAQTTFDLNNLIFNLGVTSNGPLSVTATLFSSLDDYSVSLGNIVLVAEQKLTTATYQDWTVTLSDSFDAITEDLTFRLYVNKTSGAQGETNNIFRMASITLDGLVVVPEPSALMLLGAGAGLLFFLRRRK